MVTGDADTNIKYSDLRQFRSLHHSDKLGSQWQGQFLKATLLWRPLQASGSMPPAEPGALSQRSLRNTTLERQFLI